MKVFSDESKAAIIKNKSDFQTIMPWWEYSGLSDNDLGAMYAYLKTVKPVKNQVIKYQVK